jgi:paraquat-inducible protein B
MDRLRYLLGIVTLVVMGVGGWFLFGKLQSQDLEELYRIQVTFLDAHGLKTGADVKFRGIQVGSVRHVDVEEDGAHAVILMTIANDKIHHVRNNSQFWIVTPRFHGISSGVSGLETLVRDSYVSFSTPPPFGEPLPSGTGLVGVEAPLRPRRDITLPPMELGDLLMRVLLPENHGVAVGARVMFRGMSTGEVRSIALAPSGTHVEATVRVRTKYRSTVTDASVFWVSKPQLSLKFSLSNPVSVNELSSLMSPFIAYYTEPKTGVPVPDGYPVAASLKRPSFTISEVPPEALAAKPNPDVPKPSGPVAIVRVIYEAIDVDYLSPNDTVRREGTGFLYLDTTGRALVLTARSVCDAAYFYTETFGERAKITSEKIAVQLPGSNVLKATRIWPHPDGLDIAVLMVRGLPRNYPTTKPGVVSFLNNPPTKMTGLTVHAAGEGGQPVAPTPFDPTHANMDKVRGGVIMRGDKVVGFVGQTSDSLVLPKLVILGTLPVSLRPGD